MQSGSTWLADFFRFVGIFFLILTFEASCNTTTGAFVCKTTGKVLLCQTDATQLPFLPASFRVVCANAPWGQLTGSHEANRDLYPRLLAEAARLTAPEGIFVLLTHEITLLESLLPSFSTMWELQQVVKILQGGLHPRIYLLRRTQTSISCS